jgi:hypothetical protein
MKDWKDRYRGFPNFRDMETFKNDSDRLRDEKDRVLQRFASELFNAQPIDYAGLIKKHEYLSNLHRDLVDQLRQSGDTSSDEHNHHLDKIVQHERLAKLYRDLLSHTHVEEE